MMTMHVAQFSASAASVLKSVLTIRNTSTIVINIGKISIFATNWPAILIAGGVAIGIVIVATKVNRPNSPRVPD